eukprot:1136545-Pelagomonas_calceolata.AAC.1
MSIPNLNRVALDGRQSGGLIIGTGDGRHVQIKSLLGGFVMQSNLYCYSAEEVADAIEQN